GVIRRPRREPAVRRELGGNVAVYAETRETGTPAVRIGARRDVDRPERVDLRAVYAVHVIERLHTIRESDLPCSIEEDVHDVALGGRDDDARCPALPFELPAVRGD